MPDTTWNLTPLRNAVLERHGKKVYLELSPALNSIVERQEYGRYHYHEAKDRLNGFLKSKHSESELFGLVFGRKGEGLKDFETNKFEAKAHTLACLQSMHGVLDTLSHVIYYSLNLNHAKKERDISINSVSQWLNNYPDLKKLVSQLLKHDNHIYLNSLVNHSKHKSLISPEFKFSFVKTGVEMKEFIFPAFKYREQHFEQRLAYDFLSDEFDRQGLLVVTIGNEINKIVETSRCSSSD